jgi:hypothetical protein
MKAFLIILAVVTLYIGLIVGWIMYLSAGGF